jgi:Na+-transporting NADH:ubiquinone oxidoreductase subunit NqrD
MNVKSIVSSITDGVDSLVAVATSLIVLSVFTGILFGGSVFGVSVVENIMALIQAFLDGGFTGLLALLVLLSFWR